MDPTCGLVDKFRDIVLNLTWEQLHYLIYYHRNIDQLNGQLKDLTHERIYVQHQVDEAKNNGEQIEQKVLDWLGKVDAISEQVHKLRRESEAKLKCGITSCPNPRLRYKLSKGAETIAREAAEICGKGNFVRVSYLDPPQSMPELTNRESNKRIDSRVEIKNQIMEALRNARFNMIGFCGLGGVGKTTIANDIKKEEENQKVFEKVIMATVSQDMNIGLIQDQIIRKLGMQLNDRTEEGKACRLYKRLENEKNMLLILDDLWQELDLGKVGIPFIDVGRDSKINEGCKILLTSRNETLLSKSMKCQKIIRVDVLLEDEAWELFRGIAELSIESSNHDLKSIATEIVQKCGGLPLAIATAAKALKDENIVGWRDYLARLKHPLARTVTGIKEVDTILKLSYAPLSQENKDIFLLSAMLSHDPSIEELLMYSMGLDILKHTQNMGDACDAIFGIVGKLKSLNLFLDSYSSHHFTMHDVFRDVALSIASEELNAVIVRHRRLNEWLDEIDLERCKGICLQESDICDLPEELHGPNLEFFLLNSKKDDLTIPNMFFKSSKKLKVLAITKVNFSSLPLLSFLQRLKVLCLHSCLLEDITEIRSLKKLKVLSLAYSKIQQLPVELVELTSLQMLNLSHCSKLKVIPQKLLSSLKKLEVLYMANSFNQWKVEGSSKADENASLDELMDLPISSIEIHIPNLSMLQENLFLNMDLRRYRIFIGKRWTWWERNYGASKILKLELERSIDLTAGLRNLSKGVEDLHLYGSNGQENVLYSLDASGFPCLRHLQIVSNHDIKYIVLNSAHHEHGFPILERLELQNLKALENLCEGPNDIVFRHLHTLKLQNLPALSGDSSIKDRATNNASNKIFKSLFNKVLLPKLEILELFKLNSLISLIWDDQLLHNSFNNLKTFRVRKCGFVKLVPLHVLKSLNNLEELDVEGCDMLEIVFDFEDLNDYCKEMESSSVVVPLKMLRLKNLPKLKNVWSNHYQRNVSFPGPRSLDADGCVSLTSIFPASIAKDDQLLHNSFNNLKTLRVEKCGFVKLVPLHVLKSLNNLEEVVVKSCDILEIVFDFEDLNDYYKEMDSSSIVLPLKELKLWNLPKLKNVSSDHYQGNVSFPSLRSVDVYDCESLTSIFPVSIAKGMLGDQVSESVAVSFGFPRLTSVRLFGLPNLRNFYPQKHTLEWPHRNQLSIQCCEELEIFEKEVSGSSEIYEEGNLLDSKYPLLFHDKVLLPKLEILELSNLNSLISLIWDDQLLHNSFRNLKTLKVGQCGFVKLVPLHVLKTLNNLEEVEVTYCDILEIVFDFEDLNYCYKEMDLSSLVVPLKKLKLWNLPKLKNVWSNDWQGNISFPSLRSIKVDYCESLASIFPASIAKGMLGDLEELQISYCSIDVIVAKDQVTEFAAAAFQFPRLTSLQLGHLPQLTNFYPQRHTIEWPLLQPSEIFEKEVSSSSEIYKEENTLDSKYPLQSHDKVLPKLEILKLSKLNSLIPFLWDDQLLYNSFNNLKILTVEKCGFLKLVPLHVLKSLNNLGKLEIISCDMLEIVFDFEDFNDYYKEMDSSSVVVPLKELTLNNLPKLKNVWSNNWQGNVSFRSLRSVYVNNCVSLTSIFPASIAKGMLCDLEELKIYQCGVDVIVAEGQVSESVPVTFRFPNLTSLVLSRLPNLRSFYSQKHTLEWSQLSQLFIQCCDELEIFEQKEVSSSSEIYEEENMLDSKYPLLPHDKVIRNLERLKLQGKQVEKIGSGQFLMYHFPKLMLLHLSLEEKPYDEYWERSPNLEELKLSGNFEKFVEGNNVAALHFPKLTLKNISNMRSLSPSLVSPPNLTHLKVDYYYEWTTLITSSIARSLVHLTHLSVSNCYQIEEIITKQEGEDDEDREIFFNKMKFLEFVHLSRLRRFCCHNYTFRFPLLEHVTIRGCPRLTMFCPGAIHAPQLQSIEVNESNSPKDIWMTDLNNTIQHLFTFKEVRSTTRSMVINAKNITRIEDVFPNVSSLYVESFTDEGVTFPYSSLEKFPKLKWLEVEHCSFEEIFPSQDQIIDFMGKISPFVCLDIAYMDKLKSIWKDDSHLPPIHQNLIVLRVKSCCSLVKVAPSSASFQNLSRLYVCGCPQLIHLVTTSTAKSLVSLEMLEIKDCKRMEEIIMNDTNNDVQGGITFNRLSSIKLIDMPSLKMFSLQSHTFEFPELKGIEISGCLEMKKFCPGVLKTPKLSKVKIEEHSMESKDEENLNKTMEGLSSTKDSINI